MHVLCYIDAVRPIRSLVHTFECCLVLWSCWVRGASVTGSSPWKLH
jgi:hypothetical protein